MLHESHVFDYFGSLNKSTKTYTFYPQEKTPSQSEDISAALVDSEEDKSVGPPIQDDDFW